MAIRDHFRDLAHGHMSKVTAGLKENTGKTRCDQSSIARQELFFPCHVGTYFAEVTAYRGRFHISLLRFIDI